MQNENPGDAIRAGVVTAFFLFGASVVLGTVVEAGSLVRLVLALSAPVTAVLVGVCAYRSAQDGGAQ